jgi:hypothetical protein
MTIIYPSLPSGHSVFCDDIRFELNGKISLIGTYGNTMFVGGAFPIFLPKLCVAIVYREEPDSPLPVAVKVFLPGQDYDNPAVTFEIDPPQPDLIPEQTGEFLMREARFFWEGAAIEIKEEGQIRVRAFRGEEEIRLGAMRVLPHPELQPAGQQAAANSSVAPEPPEPNDP